MDSEVSSESDDEYNSLVTRSKFYSRPQTDISASTPVRKSTRVGKNLLLCKEHNDSKQVPGVCTECISFPVQESLPNGRLPTTGQVMSYMLTLNENNPGKNNILDVASDIILHWISCNIYTKARKNVTIQLEDVFKNYRDLQKYPKKKRGDTFYQKSP